MLCTASGQQHALRPAARPSSPGAGPPTRSYDSTIGVAGGSSRLWPATMEDGVPYDCDQAGQYCSGSESYPGVW